MDNEYLRANRETWNAWTRINAASAHDDVAGFGAGKTVGHWGGRLIWQLADADQLIVAWKETPGRVPRQVEAELIRLFRQQYGKPPFANDPHRLGA